ncbi:MAG: chloramphenicol phosphotransferase [Anaerolineaceae bacterium]
MTARTPTIYHLIGKPGVGKYTVGSELVRLTGARFVDSHSIANVIFNLIDPDGLTPLPDGIWSRVGQVRAAVLDTIIHLSPPHLSFVFTNYLRGEDASEDAILEELVAIAQTRKSTYVPVLLSCKTAELVARIVSEDRRARMKLIDPIEGARLNDHVPQFEPNHPNTLRLDVTHIPPAETAQAIIDWREQLENPPVKSAQFP